MTNDELEVKMDELDNKIREIQDAIDAIKQDLAMIHKNLQILFQGVEKQATFMTTQMLQNKMFTSFMNLHRDGLA